VKLTSDSFSGNGIQDEYSALLSLVLQQFCTFSKQSFSMYDDLFLSVLTFAHSSSLLKLSSHDSHMLT
jgi:hypothetical protein